MAQRIILLDLNFTLVSNVHPMHFRYGPTVGNENFRGWLIELVRTEYVIMMTTRDKRYQNHTLRRIQDLHGWGPQEAFFKPDDMARWPAQEWKRYAMLRHVLPTHGRDVGRYLALESNRHSRSMYAAMGVEAVRVDVENPFTELPPFTGEPGYVGGDGYFTAVGVDFPDLVEA